MPRMVCMKCGQFFHPHKNGIVVEEGMPADSDQKRGKGNWLPYKLWCADLWKCLGCGDEIVSGFAASPLHEHYEADYERVKRYTSPIIFIKDCL